MSDNYNNNPSLKKKEVPLQYTQFQIDEIFKCCRDIVYFLQTYIFIISLDQGKILFNPYHYQIKIIEQCKKNRFNIFTLARQMGKSITIAAYLLYEAIFNKDVTIAVLANNGPMSREILGRIKMMYEELPMWLKPGVVTWNKGSVEFSNGSRIFAGPTTPTSLRGYSISILYLDEFAFVENDIEFYTSAYPVVSSGQNSKIIITSTPNGMNLFYKLWTDSINGRNAFKHKIYTWKAHPNRDAAWKATSLKNMSQKQFSQEFECKFLGSSNTLISGDGLAKLVYKDPIESGEWFKIYEKPIPNDVYVACVDVSEGVGKDFSTVIVFNISRSPYKQVYVYRRNDISPWNFSEVVVAIAQNYNRAHLLVENNSVGKIVADGIFYEHDYDNMLSSTLKNGEEFIRGMSMREVGLRITQKTKTIGCSALKTLVEEDLIELVDWDTIQELSSFIKVGTTYKAEKNKHDDTVMPLVHFGWLTTQPYFQDLTDSGMRDLLKARRDSEEDNYHTAFGFYDDGISNSNEMFA